MLIMARLKKGEEKPDTLEVTDMLRKLRLNATEFARIAGLHAASWSLIRKGYARPTIATQAKINRVLEDCVCKTCGQYWEKADESSAAKRQSDEVSET